MVARQVDQDGAGTSLVLLNALLNISKPPVLRQNKLLPNGAWLPHKSYYRSLIDFSFPLLTGGVFCQIPQQYPASLLLSTLRSFKIEPGEKCLGMVDFDLYSPGLNFVFGEADIRCGVAIISLYRLKQERYGLPQDEALFRDRASKEAVHELGHTYHLSHCQDARCVMHFSNSLADTDIKRTSFCQKCQQRLKQGEIRADVAATRNGSSAVEPKSLS